MENTGKNIITKETVEYVARLSRLSLDESETDRFRGQLEGILDYIEQLKEVDTEGTLPTTHVLPSMKNVFREDKLTPSLSNDDALANAPSKKDGFFKVPRVIKD
ncbi:MAG: Asp-tRNA(Asn)/Glu-tRNA(Gln) amidotransferase subunit GatC [Candidatus Tantalella remota]|nr:Asp-tRNA(Asn)/Glu-tRNA(Gln) amidotransferase subunit GatC [Candidatus Tantalella remota]